MKIRLGFVSNSSSSSFIVIGDCDFSIPDYNCEKLKIPMMFGTTEFGWTVEDHRDFASLVNFAYIQATYLDEMNNNDFYKDILRKVLEEHLNCSEIIFNGLDDCYIDHQSSSCEGENIEMFDSEEKLFNFLFSNESYIHTDNDNY